MGLLDGLSSVAGDDSADGMTGMMEHLAANGLADHVASWTAGGQNLPVSADQLRGALGNDKVQQISAAAGQPAEDFLQQLSDHEQWRRCARRSLVGRPFTPGRIAARVLFHTGEEPL